MNPSSMPINELTEKVIGCAYEVHRELGAGFLEKVYENALGIRLTEVGINSKQQAPLPVYYHGQRVGDFVADILIENRLIIEIKAGKGLAQEHEVQLVNYLVTADIENGLLINFGRSVQIKRKFRDYR